MEDSKKDEEKSSNNLINKKRRREQKEKAKNIGDKLIVEKKIMMISKAPKMKKRN